MNIHSPLRQLVISTGSILTGITVNHGRNIDALPNQIYESKYDQENKQNLGDGFPVSSNGDHLDKKFPAYEDS